MKRSLECCGATDKDADRYTLVRPAEWSGHCRYEKFSSAPSLQRLETVRNLSGDCQVDWLIFSVALSGSKDSPWYLFKRQHKSSQSFDTNCVKMIRTMLLLFLTTAIGISDQAEELREGSNNVFPVEQRSGDYSSQQRHEHSHKQTHKHSHSQEHR